MRRSGSGKAGKQPQVLKEALERNPGSNFRTPRAPLIEHHTAYRKSMDLILLQFRQVRDIFDRKEMEAPKKAFVDSRACMSKVDLGSKEVHVKCRWNDERVTFGSACVIAETRSSRSSCLEA